MENHIFYMTILGRTIEHLGTQMYKHRAPSIAELVANCWDAGAQETWITIPEPPDYDPAKSIVVVMDSGEGMDESTVQNKYLVVGRNRRSDGGGMSHGRKLMGRKGIGKLAGFGLAEKITVTTWTNDTPRAIQFSMSLKQLKGDSGKSHEIPFPWHGVDKKTEWPVTGTRIELSELRHSSPIQIQGVQETLARRFSRITRGEMRIKLNDKLLAEPDIETFYKFPEEGEYKDVDLLPDKKIKYNYRFANKPLRSKELQGFVVFANERTAQAPPFFFNIESTASAQHSTRYVTGEIIADYVDAGIDDESDVISTDRQELDWEREDLKELREWGEVISRKVLRDCAEMMGKRLENWVFSNQSFSQRLDLIDPSARKEISQFLKKLGEKTDENDERTRDLADALIRAYEYRNFHDVIDDIKSASNDPDKLEELLGRIHDWRVLESRAILEIVRGRLSIITKFESMIVNNAPETASSRSHDNLHDLLAEYPWIFNPEWQVFTEEKTISKQLREWGEKDFPEAMKDKRVDFLAFEKNTDALIIIELKRSGHAVELDELQRLEQYQVSFMKSRKNCRRVLVYGGTVNIPENKWKPMSISPDFEAITWSEMFTRAKAFYSHYKSVLEGDTTAEGFHRKEAEVARTRTILETGSSYRSKEDRERGIGNQDL